MRLIDDEKRLKYKLMHNVYFWIHLNVSHKPISRSDNTFVDALSLSRRCTPIGRMGNGLLVVSHVAYG